MKDRVIKLRTMEGGSELALKVEDWDQVVPCHGELV